MPVKGKPLSEEHKAKIAAAQSKKLKHKHEYKSVFISANAAPQEKDQHFNEMAVSGWRLIHEKDYIYTFERSKR